MNGQDGQKTVELSLLRNEIKVDSYSYIRWKGLEEFVQDVKSRVLSLFPTDIPVLQIKLEYWDRFISNSSEDAWSQVFVAGDRLPARSVDERGPWHAYLGWFEPLGAERALVNVHIDTFDQSEPTGAQFRAANIYTLVALQFQSAAPSLGTILPFDANKLQPLHDLSKRVTGSILTDEMRKRISLSVEGLVK